MRRQTILVIGAATLASITLRTPTASAEVTITPGMTADDHLGTPGFGWGYDEYLLDPGPARTREGISPGARNMIFAEELCYLIVTDTSESAVKIYDLCAFYSIGLRDPVAVLGHPTGGVSYESPAPGVGGGVNVHCGEPAGSAGEGYSGQPDACSLSYPDGAAYWPGRKWLFVSDLSNARVTVYDLSDGAYDHMPAFAVLGQPHLETRLANHACGPDEVKLRPNPCGMNAPFGVSLDPDGALLYVGDEANERIMVFDVDEIVDGEPAIAFIGQADGYTQGQYRSCDGTTYNGYGPPTRCGISGGDDSLWDSVSRTLFVMDHDRILSYELGPDPKATLLAELPPGHEILPADYVIGQSDFVSNLPGDSPDRFDSLFYIGLSLSLDHEHGRAFITDYLNCRVKVYDISSGVRAGLEGLSSSYASIGWTTLTDPGVEYPWDGYPNCAADGIDPETGASYGWVSDDRHILLPTDVTWIPGLDVLAVLETLNGMVKLYGSADDDDDGALNGKDWCPGTDLGGPIPTQGLKRQDYLSDKETVHGCNASQILACKGGDTVGQTKFGVPPSIQNVFTGLIGWAKDTDGNGIPDCLEQE